MTYIHTYLCMYIIYTFSRNFDLPFDNLKQESSLETWERGVLATASDIDTPRLFGVFENNIHMLAGATNVCDNIPQIFSPRSMVCKCTCVFVYMSIFILLSRLVNMLR